MKELLVYNRSLNDAIAMMNRHEGLEPRSALKQCASDNGIPYGDKMEEFVLWAEDVLEKLYKD